MSSSERHRRITVNYHAKRGSWWADSPDITGWSATGPTLNICKAKAQEGVAFAFEVEQAMPRSLEVEWSAFAGDLPIDPIATQVFEVPA